MVPARMGDLFSNDYSLYFTCRPYKWQAACPEVMVVGKDGAAAYCSKLPAAAPVLLLCFECSTDSPILTAVPDNELRFKNGCKSFALSGDKGPARATHLCGFFRDTEFC